LCVMGNWTSFKFIVKMTKLKVLELQKTNLKTESKIPSKAKKH
jgi:hypothetical protein